MKGVSLATAAEAARQMANAAAIAESFRIRPGPRCRIGCSTNTYAADARTTLVAAPVNAPARGGYWCSSASNLPRIIIGQCQRYNEYESLPVRTRAGVA